MNKRIFLAVAILLASTLGTGCATTSNMSSLLARLDAAEERARQAEEKAARESERASRYEGTVDEYLGMTPDELAEVLAAERRLEEEQRKAAELEELAAAAIAHAEAVEAEATRTPVPLSGGSVVSGGSIAMGSAMIPSGSAPMYVGYLPAHLSRKDVVCVENYSSNDPYWILPIPSGELPPVAYNPQGPMPTEVSISGMVTALHLIPPGERGCFEPSGPYSSITVAYFDGPLFGVKRLVGVMERGGRTSREPWGGLLSAPGPGTRSGGSFDRVARLLLSLRTPGVAVTRR